MRPGFALLILLLVSPLGAQAFDWSFRAETGSFNKAYQDRQYLTPTSVTLGVPYGAFGAELNRTDADGNVLSLGLAQTTIASGRTYNWNRWEVQPLTMMNFAAVSVGKDYGWMEVGFGVGGIVQIKDFTDQSYLGADGHPGPGRPGGLGWNRSESFTVVTGLFRVLPESQPHFAIRIARGPLSLAENLMHVQAVLPLQGSRLDTEIGFSSPLGLIFHGRGVLRSNERITLGWSFGDSGARVGLRLGFLLRTIVEGSGEVDLARRLSLGVDWSLGTGSD